jgi:hypothetical protein
MNPWIERLKLLLPSWKKYLAICLSGLFAIGAFLFGRGCDKKKDAIISVTTLRPEEEEAVIVNPSHHSIILITPTRSKKLTLPDRPSRISLLKGDGLKIDSPQFGTEIRPFVGVGYTLNGGVVNLGLDLVYWKRVDLGMGLIVNPVDVRDTQIFLGVSTYIYSNTSLGLGLGNRTTPILFLKVRL